jgi:hypothetical protein
MTEGGIRRGALCRLRAPAIVTFEMPQRDTETPERDLHARLSSLGYDWLAATIALEVCAQVVSVLLPPGLTAAIQGNPDLPLLVLVASLALSAGFVAGRRALGRGSQLR